ncbi:hypothetical protein ACFO26_05410 [Lactococcus nasutitermitis]|uniref:Type VII secretion effector n=1 Tax=Lactococcus nasutitermitis TaxID=1652957 RepID=A0ABV9JDG4_9LACT|nr:hypothetical protein [Lactococcus nasutitermitis]
MATAVKSNLGDAQNAVSKFKESGTTGQKYSLGESNISGMKRAAKLSNEIIGDLSKLESGIKTQADKFPKLAAVMEERDKKDASNLSQMNWGF